MCGSARAKRTKGWGRTCLRNQCYLGQDGHETDRRGSSRDDPEEDSVCLHFDGWPNQYLLTNSIWPDSLSDRANTHPWKDKQSVCLQNIQLVGIFLLPFFIDATKSFFVLCDCVGLNINKGCASGVRVLLSLKKSTQVQLLNARTYFTVQLNPRDTTLTT